MSRMHRTLFTSFGVLSAVFIWSCGPDIPSNTDSDTDEGGYHDAFPIAGGHLNVGCDSCHINGAVEQGIQPSESPLWTAELSTDCLGCHLDTAQTIFPSGHKDGQTCSTSGCHKLDDTCWRSIRGACVPPPPPPPTGAHTPPPPLIGHEGARGILFPLEGVHDLPSCVDCHTGTTDDEQRGGSVNCEMCHQQHRPANHKLPTRAGGSADERRCKACHATEAADGKLIVPSSWTDGAVDHDLYWPHNGVDFDVRPPVPTPDTAWVTDCITCHTTPGVQDEAGVTCALCHVPIGTSTSPQELELSQFHSSVTQPCQFCHPTGDNG